MTTSACGVGDGLSRGVPAQFQKVDDVTHQLPRCDLIVCARTAVGAAPSTIMKAYWQCSYALQRLIPKNPGLEVSLGVFHCSILESCNRLEAIGPGKGILAYSSDDCLDYETSVWYVERLKLVLTNISNGCYDLCRQSSRKSDWPLVSHWRMLSNLVTWLKNRARSTTSWRESVSVRPRARAGCQ
jgi:replicative DNA helicase